jgi:SAM-dependent methyltransferase
MVGGQGDSGPAADRLNPAVRAAYQSAAAGWDDGPGPLYADLARALLAQPGVLAAGRRVLDVGAGTGAAGVAALAAGAVSVVAADLAPGMLRSCPAPLRPVAASATALPFADQSFDLAVAAFCLGHLDSIPDCLRELRRTCAAMAASAFAPGWTHPAKAAVDGVLAAFGYRAPAWYLTFKQDREPRAAAAAELEAQAVRTGCAAQAASAGPAGREHQHGDLQRPAVRGPQRSLGFAPQRRPSPGVERGGERRDVRQAQPPRRELGRCR